MKTTKEKIPVSKDEEDNKPADLTEEADNTAAPISEEFQQGLMSHLKGANKHELTFARNHISDLEDAARKQENDENPVSMTDYPH